jgi:hypothetical protein
MKRDDIVRQLLGRGIMVTPEVLEKINSGEDMESIFQHATAKPCAVLSNFWGAGDKTNGEAHPVQKIQAPAPPSAGSPKEESPKQKPDEQVKCTVLQTTLKHVMTPEEAVAMNMERFEKIRKMLLRKVDAVSIKNLGKSTQKVSIVGMVREKDGGGLILEDGSGEILVKAKDALRPDDIVGARGWARDGTFFAEEIFYPDVPINREPCTLGKKLILSCDGKPATKGDFVLTPCALIGSGEDKALTNPAWIFLESGGKKVTVLVYRPHSPASREDALSWLRKRYMSGGEDLFSGPENVIDDIPDIFWVVSGTDPWHENYKGVSIISFGGGHSATIDLSTGKIEIRTA